MIVKSFHDLVEERFLSRMRYHSNVLLRSRCNGEFMAGRDTMPRAPGSNTVCNRGCFSRSGYVYSRACDSTRESGAERRAREDTRERGKVQCYSIFRKFIRRAWLYSFRTLARRSVNGIPKYFVRGRYFREHFNSILFGEQSATRWHNQRSFFSVRKPVTASRGS